MLDQSVDASGQVGVGVPVGEEAVLDLVDVLLEPIDDGGVPVDDLVEECGEHGFGFGAEEVWFRFERLPDCGQVRAGAAAEGDDEARPDEQVDLAELDPFSGIVVSAGPEDDEHGVAVPFELGALVTFLGVLDGEGPEPEPVRGVGEGAGVGIS